MIKAVIFDLDGTLANTLLDLCESANRAIEKFGFRRRTLEEYRIFVGNGIVNLLDRATDHTADEQTLSRIKDEFFLHYNVHYCDKTVAYDGAKELINAVRARGLKTAVVTNKDDEIAKIIVDKLFGDVFELVCGRRDAFPLKPDPALTLDVMDKLGVSPCECIFLGDSGVDVETGRNSGAVAVGETWGFRDRPDLVKSGAQYIIDRPCELIPIIDELDG